MSKPTSHNVLPYDFQRVFGFTPCSCHEGIRTAGSALYRVEYETEPFTQILKKVTVTCLGCYRSTTRDVQSRQINGEYIGF